MSNQTRNPAGVPTGGQFAAHDRDDAEATLSTSGVPWHAAREAALAKSSELDDGMHETRLHWLLTTPPAEAALRMREAARAAEHSQLGEMLKPDGEFDADWAETHRRMADGHLAIAQKLETASEYEHGDAPAGSSGTVGAWTVSVGGGEVVAGRRDSSLTYSTGLWRFPIGWRVSPVWTPETPPKSVIALANRLARRLP